MINFEITNEQEIIEITKELEDNIKLSVTTAVGEFNIPCDIEFSVMFTDNDKIRVINKDFRNIDCETDVLSFPQLEFQDLGVIEKEYLPNGDYPLMIGDIVISLEKAKSQAEEFSHSFLREVCYLTVHSVLHLLGYDHIEKEDKKIMREKEEIIMNKLGLVR